MKQQSNTTAQENSSSEDNIKTARDRFKNTKLQEDTGQGKCTVCPLVYNNYKEHCKSLVHKNRYLEALKQENIYQNLIDLSKNTEIKQQICTVFSTLCVFLQAKYLVSFEKAAYSVNQILQ